MAGPNAEPPAPLGPPGRDGEDGAGDGDGDGFGEEGEEEEEEEEEGVFQGHIATIENGEELSVAFPDKGQRVQAGTWEVPLKCGKKILHEYAAINSMLDQINSCLDHLEEKNDYLHACLKELLESNRQTRLEFQQQSEQQNMEPDAQGPQPPV